jgi:hypothetical protein
MNTTIQNSSEDINIELTKKEKKALYDKKYKELNEDKIKAYQHNYRQINKSILTKKKRIYRANKAKNDLDTIKQH